MIKLLVALATIWILSMALFWAFIHGAKRLNRKGDEMQANQDWENWHEGGPL